MTTYSCDEIVDLWFAAKRGAATLEQGLGDRLEAELGISLGRFALLSAVAERGGANQQVLTQALGLTKGSVSRQIDHAVRDGHLVAAASETSRRENAVDLTETGRSLVASGNDLIVASAPSALAELDRSTYDLVLATLNSMAEGRAGQSGD